MILIGITGRAGSGKDTAFGLIKEWADDRSLIAVRRGFADLLKLSAYRLFKPDCNLDEALEWADEFKVRGTLTSGPIRPRFIKNPDQPFDSWLPENIPTHHVTGREFFQRFGTESHRDLMGNDIWVNALLPEIFWEENFRLIDSDPSTVADIAVITDVRFPNEAHRIKNLGGVIWRVIRDEDELRASEGHASESALPDSIIDHEVYNLGSLDDFRDTINMLMRD